MMRQFLFIFFAIALLAPSLGRAQKIAVAREVAEQVLAKFGKEAAGETVETLVPKIARISARYGDDGITAIEKVGPRAFNVISEAGDHSAGVVTLMAKHGSESIWVVSKPKGMAIFVKYGDEGAEAIMKHKGIATPLIEKAGQPGVKALNAVNPANGRKLVNLVDDGLIVPGQKSEELLGVVGRYGDRAMDFVWRNKGALAVGATLTTFLANPEPYIEGALQLPGALAEGIASRTNWTVVILAAMLFIGFYLWFTGRMKRPSAEPSSET